MVPRFFTNTPAAFVEIQEERLGILIIATFCVLMITRPLQSLIKAMITNMISFLPTLKEYSANIWGKL